LHAFEPVPHTFKVLEENLHYYDGPNLHLNNCGLSEKKGTVDFYIKQSCASNSYVNNIDYTDIIQCQIITLDEYVKRNRINQVDFIKADIEGAERDMLLGASEVIKKFKPKLSICTYHLPDDPQVIEDIIKKYSNDYTIIHKWKKIYAYV